MRVFVFSASAAWVKNRRFRSGLARYARRLPSAERLRSGKDRLAFLGLVRFVWPRSVRSHGLRPVIPHYRPSAQIFRQHPDFQAHRTSVFTATERLKAELAKFSKCRLGVSLCSSGSRKVRFGRDVTITIGRSCTKNRHNSRSLNRRTLPKSRSWSPIGPP